MSICWCSCITCVYACIFVCMHVFVHVSMITWMCVCMSACSCICSGCIDIHTHMHIVDLFNNHDVSCVCIFVTYVHAQHAGTLQLRYKGFLIQMPKQLDYDNGSWNRQRQRQRWQAKVPPSDIWGAQALMLYMQDHVVLSACLRMRKIFAEEIEKKKIVQKRIWQVQYQHADIRGASEAWILYKLHHVSCPCRLVYTQKKIVQEYLWQFEVPPTGVHGA